MSGPGSLLLEAARVSHGLSQSELAARTKAVAGTDGVSQGVISKIENGSFPLTDDRAAVLATALGESADLLLTRSLGPGILHRFPTTVSAKATRTLEAQMQLARARLHLLAPRTDRIGRVPRGDYFGSDGTLQARHLRERWVQSNEPIGSMVRLVEDHGIPCLRRDLRAVNVAAVGGWKFRETRAVLLIDHAADDLEVRFAIAHELGHAAMHRAPDKAHEAAATAYAYELLLPEAALRGQLRGADPSALIDLETEWGVSATRLAHRALQLGVVSRPHHKRLLAILNSTPFERPRRKHTEAPEMVATEVRNRISRGQTRGAIAAAMLLQEDRLRPDYLAGSHARPSGA